MMRAVLGLALSCVVTCVACGGTATPSVVSPPPSQSVPAVTSTGFATPTSAATSTAATSPILRIALDDVRSGERFTLGGFAGKTVIVQGMAVW